jgi:general stress protein CsbA
MTLTRSSSVARLPLAIAIDANAYLSYLYAFFEITITIKKYIDASSLKEYWKSSFAILLAST